MKRYPRKALLLLFVAALAAGCAPQAGEDAGPVQLTRGVETAENTPEPTPAATEEAAEVTPEGLRPIPVDHVQILSGIASPTPALVSVSGSWPDLCAQLAEVSQSAVAGFQIEIALLATPADPSCPPDMLGLPFRIDIPINWNELPEGAYTVSVNGQETTLYVPVIPPPADPQTGPVLGPALTPTPGGAPPVQESPVAGGEPEAEPIPVEVQAVSLQVGVGSPIPVYVQVEAGWPSLCSQLAKIRQTITDFQIDVTMLAYQGRADCPPDYVGYGFSINLPINVVELPEGGYTVTVNGVSTTLDVPVTPPAAEPEAGGGQTDSGTISLCPELARPALTLLLADGGYALFDPASGATCPLSFADVLPGMIGVVQNDLYVAGRAVGPEGEAAVIRRYAPDGAAGEFELPPTLVDAQAGTELVGFTVLPDARLIAWSVLGPTAGSDWPSTALTIADMETGQLLVGISPDVGQTPVTLLPIRFSQDGSKLFYALQPTGLGGIWSSYVGRYDNLYAVATDGTGEQELIFDCAGLEEGLCLGDFLEVEGEVTGLAYVDRETGTVVIENGEGEVLNTLAAEEEYVGYPTWGPGGELVYYSADLSDDPAASPLPVMGLLYRVAPHTGPAETLASDPALLLPVRFLDDTHVVVLWSAESGARGLAVVGVDGTVEVLDVPAGATLLGLPVVATLLGVPGGGGIVSTP
jgi:hypothetical protein